jgi:hypothetical protein
VTGSIGFAKQKPDAQRTNLGKSASKYPAKKPGVSGDAPKKRKALAPKKGK